MIDNIRITIDDGSQQEVRNADPTDGPVSLTVLRDGDGTSFTVRVQGFLNNTVVATARAEVSFTDETSLSLPIVLNETCQQQECVFSNQLRTFEVPVASQRVSCDGISDRYEVQVTAFETTVDACTAGVQERDSLDFDVDNDGTILDVERETNFTSDTLLQAIENEFDFRFYGEQINTIWISEDGYLSFGQERAQSLASQVAITDLDGPGAPNFAIIPFWEDLQLPPTGEVCAALIGAGDNQRLWITWKNACFGPSCDGGDRLTFSVGLEEITNKIIIDFEEMVSANNQDRAEGNGASVGILGLGGPNCSLDQCSAQGTCTDGSPCGYTQFLARTDKLSAIPTIITFTPIPGS